MSTNQTIGTVAALFDSVKLTLALNSYWFCLNLIVVLFCSIRALKTLVGLIPTDYAGLIYRIERALLIMLCFCFWLICYYGPELMYEAAMCAALLVFAEYMHLVGDAEVGPLIAARNSVLFGLPGHMVPDPVVRPEIVEAEVSANSSDTAVSERDVDFGEYDDGNAERINRLIKVTQVPGHGMNSVLIDGDPIDISLLRLDSGLEVNSDDLEFVEHPSSMDYGFLGIRGKNAGHYADYIGKIYVGNSFKFVGYGVFVDAYFITLTKIVSGCNIFVVAPKVSLRPVLWKANSGFSIYYTGLNAPLKLGGECHLISPTMVVCSGEYVNYQNYTNVTARYGSTRVYEDDHSEVTMSGTVDFCVHKTSLGLPLMSSKYVLSGLFLSTVDSGDFRYQHFTEGFLSVYETRPRNIVVSRISGYDAIFG